MSLPGLLRAFRISERAAKTGFDWDNADQVLEKVREELAELEHARRSGDHDAQEEELGDLLFALVNYGRHLGVSRGRRAAPGHRQVRAALRTHGGSRGGPR
ncbi:MAG: hypothetical protein M5R36_27485 [Deltaproteobacteria bacterium]|nr:hypothetical protein [Deltaproteobacteria bacterium]